MSEVLAPRRPEPVPDPPRSQSWLSGLWRRQLPHYSDNWPRSLYLGIVVLATIAGKDSPKQWRLWWFVCVAAQIAFLALIFVMAGRWSPRGAREDTERHEQAVQRERHAMDMGTGMA